MSARTATSADVTRLHELRKRCLAHRQVLRDTLSEKLSLPSKLWRHPLITAGATTAVAMLVAPLAIRAARGFRTTSRVNSLLRGASGGWVGAAGLVAAPLIDIALQSALKWLQERQPAKPKPNQLELLPPDSLPYNRTASWSRP
jgi:hypothetical protein